MKILLFFFFALVMFSITPSSYAHSGGTDAYGGHNCYVGACAGTYHYHNGGYEPEPEYEEEYVEPEYEEPLEEDYQEPDYSEPASEIDSSPPEDVPTDSSSSNLGWWMLLGVAGIPIVYALKNE